MLLLSGRTTEDIGTGGRTIGINTQSGLDMMGQASRDAVSNLVGPYIDDTLQTLTGHKLNLRPTVGADGFEVRRWRARAANLPWSCPIFGAFRLRCAIEPRPMPGCGTTSRPASLASNSTTRPSRELTIQWEV